MCFKFNTKNQFLNFFRAQTTILNNEQEIEKFKTLYEELTTELAESRKKEDEMLQFTKSVTEKNVALQSKFSSLEAMVRNFSYLYIFQIGYLILYFINIVVLIELILHC